MNSTTTLLFCCSAFLPFSPSSNFTSLTEARELSSLLNVTSSGPVSLSSCEIVQQTYPSPHEACSSWPSQQLLLRRRRSPSPHSDYQTTLNDLLTTTGIISTFILLDMNNMASTYQSQGRINEAEQLNLQVLEGRKKTLGPDPPSTLTSLTNLAIMYLNHSRFGDTEKLGVEALDARKRTFGDAYEHETLDMLVSG